MVKRFDRRLHMLVTAEEHAMLTELADREGFSPSDMVRQLVRRAHATAFGAGAAAAPKAKPKARTRK